MFGDGSERFLVFGVGNERFAVALSSVEEVIDVPPVQPLPDAPRAMLGIATLRGSLVTLYDPHPLLNVAGTARDAALLFTRRVREGEADRRAGLVIDALFDTILIESSEVRSAPGAGASDRVLVGLVRRDAELIAILDAEALLDAAMGEVSSEAHGERT